MDVDQRELEFAADAIADADSVVALTGAGVSTASGIPDFRGSDGLWSTYDQRDFHIDRFRTDPGGFWDDRLDLQEMMYDGEERVQPNACHEALATLQREGHLDSLVTQNIDGLHQDAGSEDVIELHGNNERVVCQDCRSRFGAEPVDERARAGELPPRCPEEGCDGVLKPDTVLFGEQLPEYAMMKAHAAAEGADAFLAVGSSLTVEPAASLPRTAADKGATLVVVNFDRTPLSDRAEYDFRADVTEVLPAIAAAL
jgi:NAD-dependent deacetylase